MVTGGDDFVSMMVSDIFYSKVELEVGCLPQLWRE